MELKDRVAICHANDAKWVRLCKEVLEEAKKVTKLGGGKVKFIGFAEKEDKNERGI